MKNEIINYIKEVGPVTMDQLADQLGASSAKSFTDLVKLVSSMEGSRQLVFDNAGRIALPAQKCPKQGDLAGHFPCPQVRLWLCDH